MKIIRIVVWFILSVAGFVSDGILLSAQKYAKSVKGTPLKIPDFTGAAQSVCFSIDRHLLIEMANLMPRCRYIAVIGALCLCFGVPGVDMSVSVLHHGSSC